MRTAFALLWMIGLTLSLRGGVTIPAPSESSTGLQAIPIPEQRPANGVPPERAIFRSGTDGIHGGLSSDFTLSPDGTLMVSNFPYRGLIIWEVETGKIRRQIPTTGERILHVCFSPDGKFLTYGEGPIIKLVEVETGKRVGETERHPSDVWQVAYSRDGQQLWAHCYQNEIYCYDAKSLKRIRLIQLPRETAPNTFVLSAKGDRLAVLMSSYRVMQFELLPETKLIRDFLPEGNGAGSAFFLGDGDELLIASHTGELLLYNWKEGKKQKSIKSQAIFVTLSADQTKLALSEVLPDQKERFRTLDLKNWKFADEFPITYGEYTRLALSPKGDRVYTFGNDRIIRTWEIATGKEVTRSQGHDGPISGVGFTPDGKQVISSGEDGTLRFWDIETGKESKRFGSPGQFFHSIAISPDGTRMAIGSTRERKIRGFEGGRGFGGNSGYEGQAKLHLWDLKKNAVYKTFELPRETLNQLQFTGSGTRLMTLSGDTVRIREYETGQEVSSISLSTSWGVSAVSISRDGKQLATSTNEPGLRQIGKIAYWDTETGKEIYGRTWRLVGFSSIAFSPDGKHLAVAGSDDRVSSEGTFGVHLWKVPTDERLYGLQKAKFGATQLVYSPDARMLAVAYPDSVSIYEARTGQLRFTLKGHVGEVWSLAFSRDSRLLATGGSDAQVIVWDLVHPRTEGKIVTPKNDAGQRLLNWNELVQIDGGIGANAMSQLIYTPKETMALLREELTFAPKDSEERLTKLTKELDSPNFKNRELAARELEKLGGLAVSRLLEVLKDNPSDEVRDRIEKIIKKIGPGEDPRTSTVARRAVRTVELLERIGSPEAIDLLDQLARRSTDVVYQQESLAALKRLRAEK
jgi:WD40 repeat protein